MARTTLEPTREGGRAPGATRSRHTAPVPTRLSPALAALVVAVSVLALATTSLPTAGGSAGAAVRGTLLAAFWLFAPGAVLVPRLRLAPLTRVAVAPLVGIGLLVATSTTGVWTGVWIPRTVVDVLAVAAAALAAGDLRRPTAARRPRPDRSSVVLMVAALVCVGVWAASLPALSRAQPSVLGLFVAGPWTFGASVVAAVVVLLVALRRRDVLAGSVAVGALVVVLRATASAVARVPIPASAYKHLGVVGALREHHHVLGGTDIYMRWPGMFAASAWFADASSVHAISVARWWTPAIHVVIALQVAALARALGSRAPGSVAAAGLVVLWNWVGQDYFSPQSLAMCLACGVVLLLVQSRRNRTAAVGAVVLFAVIVPTHQLTPFWLLALTAAMVVLRRTRWWVLVAMVVIVGTYVGLRYDTVAQYGIFSGTDVTANAKTAATTIPSLGRHVGGIFAKATTLLMWCSTALVLAARAWRLRWRRMWTPRAVLLPAALAFAPIVLLAGQSYGGEAILRVTLYSTPGCCAVLGPVLARALARRWSAAVAVVWALAVTLVAAESSFGQWSVNLITPPDVAAARFLATKTPVKTTVIPVIGNWPGRVSADFEEFSGTDVGQAGTPDTLIDSPLYRLNPSLQTRPLTITVAMMVTQIKSSATTPAYVVFTPSMRAWDAYYHTLKRGNYQQLLEQFSADGDWKLVRHSGDTYVFQYVAKGWPTS